MLTKRKDGRWSKKVTLPDGTVKYFYSSESTERKAEKDITQKMIAFQKDAERRHTFRAIAADWENEYRERVSDINWNKTVRATYNKIVEYFKSYSIEEITAQNVNMYLAIVIGDNFSKKTVDRHKSVLNMIMAYAVLQGYISYNPVRDIRLPGNLPKNPRQLPTTKELQTVQQHYKGFDFLPFFLLNTGLRKSEALALTYDDIDHSRKEIKINKHLIYNGNTPVIENSTKTINSVRSVGLVDRVYNMLPKRKKGLIFCNIDGTPYKEHQFRKLWKDYQKRYNLTITPHQLRHAFATMLFESGIDVKDAQDLMGHSDINLTRQIYTHIRSERKSETMEKLNQFSF